MAQHDVHRLAGGRLVVDLQTDLIGLDATRIVAPLRDSERYVAFPDITPIVEVDGQRYVVRVQEMAAVDGRRLGAPIATLDDYRDRLLRAVDILMRGF